MQSFAAVFQTVRDHYELLPARDPQLICAAGFHMNCHVLKWRKANWTLDDPTQIKSPIGGIFFSIWITKEGGRIGRAEYNLHSYRLGKLTRYRIAAREFCASFRAAFATISEAWPNVQTDFGPGTLMQGCFAIKPESLTNQVLNLVGTFRPVAAIIDDLRAHREKKPKTLRKPRTD